MKKAVAISTIDNPFNPFTDFDSWYRFDMDKGYNSSALLARFALTSDSLTDNENQEALEEALDRIIKADPLGLFIKVYEP